MNESINSVCIRLHLKERGFICNRIAFNVVTPFAYTTPIKTNVETVLFGKHSVKISVTTCNNDLTYVLKPQFLQVASLRRYWTG